MHKNSTKSHIHKHRHPIQKIMATLVPQRQTQTDSKFVVKFKSWFKVECRALISVRFKHECFPLLFLRSSGSP